jgi:hypothetical protein
MNLYLLLSLLELDPDDNRVLPLVQYLRNKRDRVKYSWGTTEENAHALLAIVLSLTVQGLCVLNK